MSSFIPLNALEDYSLSSAEEHTRELQIEEGLKIFQKALHAQRQGKLDEAFDLYDALFKIDVIHLDIDDNNLSPTVGRLKYLAYKNHGILLLEHLAHNLDDLTTTEIRDQLQDILVQFADALLVDDSDDSFLKLFSDLARIIGLKRLSRFALECIVSSPSRVFTFSESLLNHDFLNPEEVAILQEVVLLAKQLQDYVSMDSPMYDLMASQVADVAPAKKPKYISWIEPTQFKAPPLKDLKETWRGSELVVEIGVPSWRGICKGLHDSLHRLTKRKKVLNGVTIRDPYLQIGVEISSVHGKLVDEEDLEDPEDDVEMMDIIDKPAEETIEVKTEEALDSTVKVEEIPAEINIGEVENKSSTEENKKQESPENGDKKEASGNGNGSAGPPVKDTTVKTEDRDSLTVALAIKRPAEGTTSSSQPPSKRTRGRGADEPAELEKQVDPGFFNNITSFVGSLDLKFPFVDLNQLDNEEQFYQDFKAVISNWGEQGSELFLKLSSAPESNLSVPVTQILDSAAQVDDDYGAPCNVLSISPDKFLEQMSESCSLSDFRFKIIEALLGNSSLVNEIWPSELIASVQIILNHLEPQILRDVRQMFFDGQTHSDSLIKQQLYVAEARYELVANEIIADKQRITENTSKLTKSALRDREWHKKTLHQRLLAWESCVITLLSMCKTRQLSVTELELRHTWVRLSLSQCDEAEISRMRQNYEEFQVQLLDEAPDLMVRFVNFPHIQTLSLDSVNGQISKLKVASTFAKIFSPDADEDIGTRIAMLESILKGSSDTSGDRESLSAREFLQHASIDFKHKLWYLLLDAYNESGEKRISVDGYIEMLTSLSYELETAGYRNMNPNQRHTILLRTLSTMNDTVGNLAKICRDTPALLESVSREKIHELAQLCLSFLRLLQVFNQFYDRRNPEEPTPFLWDKASEKFQTMMVKLWTFFYLLFRQLTNGLDENLPQTTISTLNDILSIVHEDLGHRKCCSFANGIFVDLTLDEIVRMKWNESEADLLQNIRCRFGIQLANEHYHPTDHGATPRALKRSDGLAFQDFIMNMVYRKPSSVHNIRADLRAVMDQLYEAIGDPDKNIASTSHNMTVLGRFTVAPVTWNYIENSLRGESFLPFMTSTDPVLSASTGGFYCVQGMLALAKFRQGKKAAAPGRTEDLQAAVKFFTNDILCCPTRYESWFGIANAYEMLTEDDLMWSAEKLDVPNSIVNINQRKALLCGLNSVNLMLQQRDEKPANPQLRTFFNAVMKESQWLFLSKLFYSATANPLHGASFRQADNKIFCGMKGLYMRQNLSLPRRKQCYQVVRACLTISINSKDQPPDWYSYYLRSKVYSKLKKTTQAILGDIQKSIAVAPDKINGDILLEPHYKLVAYLYKAVKRGKLTAAEAYKELKKTPHFVEYLGEDADMESGDDSDSDSEVGSDSETESTKEGPIASATEPAADTAPPVVPSEGTSGSPISIDDATPVPGPVTAVTAIAAPPTVAAKPEEKKKPLTRMEIKFYKSCIETLRRMKVLDKRKWHHRPPFLIARIHKEVFEDYRSAKEEMVPFFNLKNQSKAPVHIWKPDFERAGKHFQYVFDYLMFFIVLLDKTDDTDAITTIGKKLRRFNNGMVNHFEAWEFTCLTSNVLMKRVTRIPEKLPDAIIPSLQFDNFDRIAQGLQDKITKSKEPASYLLSLLYYASEFRRLNNGFGSTGVVDDTVVCLYLKMLIEYAGTSLLADNKSRSSTPVVLDGAKFEFQPGSAQPPALPAPATTATTAGKKEDGKKEKTRVTRKDILLRATNLIKACSNKVGENIKLVTTKGPPAVASSNGSSSNSGTRSNSEEKEKEPTEEPEKSTQDSDVEMADANQGNTETTVEPEAEGEADKSAEEDKSDKSAEEEKTDKFAEEEKSASAEPAGKNTPKSKSTGSNGVITIDEEYSAPE
ncbi:histone transcription regulator 3 [Yarrowia lipolytica]|nr:histone transcription regulator 3 [Yarrowia lipolytica]RDW54682.1 histone transcription regulator 3 [Yarrowia lipolytica]